MKEEKRKGKRERVGFMLFVVIVSVFFLSMVFTASAATSDNLEFWISADDINTEGTTAIDSSNQRNGTNKGVNSSTGIINEAYFSDAITEGTNISGGDVQHDTWTANIWVYPNGTGSGDGDCFSTVNWVNGHSRINCFDFSAGGNVSFQIHSGVENLDSGYTLPQNAWTMITLRFVKSPVNVSIFINGTEVVSRQDADYGTRTIFTLSTLGWGVVTEFFNGRIDLASLWSRALSADEILILYNGGGGCSFDTLDFNCSSDDNINLSEPFPDNQSAFNVGPVLFNLTGNFTNDVDCSLVLNGTVNQTVQFGNGTDVLVNFSVANFSQGIHEFFINCSDNSTNESTVTNIFSFDLEDPVITTDFLNNSMYFNDNVTGQFNFTDNVLLHRVTILIDDTFVAFNQTEIELTFFQVNLSENSTNFSVGLHEINVTVADGHTAEELKSADDYNPIEGSDLVYDIKGEYEGVTIKVKEKRGRAGDSWSVTKEVDRYSEVYVPSVPLENMTFVVESNREVFIVEKPGFYGGAWLIIGNHWKDFVVVDEPSVSLSYKRINSRKVEVTVSGLQSPERVEFSSTGDLNVVTRIYNFYTLNMTESFEAFILGGFTTTLNLTVDFGNLSTINISVFTPDAVLEWNNTNFTTTLLSFNESQALFSRTVDVPFLPNGSDLISHLWHFNFSNFTNGFLNTTPENQNVTNVTVGECDSFLNFTIFNLSYFNEINAASLVIDANSYDLAFFDGTFFYNITGIFTNSSEDFFCTNLNPGNISYDWNVFGTFTLNSVDFITRLFTIDSGDPTAVSNDPSTQLDLFMIGVNDSSTVTYTWLTTEFQPVDGTMKIFKCENDSSRSLVESLTIINGLAFANLELLFTPYSFEVVIDGDTFTDTWTQCHIVSTTERQLLVDLQSVTILPVVGLFLVDCTLTNVSNVTTMTWSANPEDTTEIEACIVARRQSIFNRTEIFRNCSNQTSGSFTVAVPDLGNDYFIDGEVTQNGVKGYCVDTIVFRQRTDVSEAMGLSGILAIAILVLSFALMYASDGEKQVIASVIGVVIAFLLGITSMPWYNISAIVFLGGIVVLIGRYTKSGSVV